MKNKFEANTLFGELNVMNKALNLGFYEMLGDLELVNREVSLYRAVDADAVQDFSRRTFRPETAPRWSIGPHPRQDQPYPIRTERRPQPIPPHQPLFQQRRYDLLRPQPLKHRIMKQPPITLPASVEVAEADVRTLRNGVKIHTLASDVSRCCA